MQAGVSMSRGVTSFGWLALLSVALAAVGHCAAAQSPASKDFLISHVRVFDGEQVQDNLQVAVKGGVIRAIGSDLARWNHLPVIDGHGDTLLPGLIDAHVHIERIEDLREALRFGVTTVLDMGTVYITPTEMLKLRHIAATTLDIADVRSAGFVSRAYMSARIYLALAR